MQLILRFYNNVEFRVHLEDDAPPNEVGDEEENENEDEEGIDINHSFLGG